MSFIDFTADFITDFTAVFIMDFTANVMLNSPNFITNFMENVITSTRISLKSARFYEVHSISHNFTESSGFHYGFHCGFHLWSLWSIYEIHLVPYERPGESEESHMNQLFLLISGGFHMKSPRFHDKSTLARNGNAYVSVIWQPWSLSNSMTFPSRQKYTLG